MVRSQPLLSVRDVEASGRWYERLLGCKNDHAGDEYGRLYDGDRLIMQLHRWDVDHHHVPIGDPALPVGNGILVWFEVDDFEEACLRAASLGSEVVMARHRNPNAMHWELWIRDLDGYTVVLASADGSAC